MITVYRELAAKTDLPLHLGLTEAGSGIAGIVASSAALSPLLQAGIGDTIRVSITPRPNEPRTEEVRVARQILQANHVRRFSPKIVSCPGCGRTSQHQFQTLVEQIEQELSARQPTLLARYPQFATLTVAIMGCVVNGPGEAQNADIGIFLPGRDEGNTAIVFANGKRVCELRGDNIVTRFCDILEKFWQTKYNQFP